MKIGSTAKATPTPGGGKRKMTAQELTAELVPGVLDLCLSGSPITVDSIKEVRPTLAAVYTERYSTIPTYLGCGRSGDGLGLHRLRGGGVYQPSFENADLAIAAGRRLGWSDDQIAATVGLTWTELVEQVEGLPLQETFAVAPPPAAGGRSTAPKPPADPEAARRRKAEREAEKAAKRAAELAEKAAAEAAEKARQKAERDAELAAAEERRREEQARLAQECQKPEMQDLLAHLTDDEE